MFAQVIRGRASDAAALRARLDDWLANQASAATGWLGSTGGLTDDGQFVAVVRFADEEAARRNSERPEQGEWWAETAKLIGDATFADSTDVVVDTPGDPDQAGFVQVMQGRGTDVARAKEIMSQDSEAWAAFRPELLGSVMAIHDGGRFTCAFYFTSEAEARAGEQKEAPPELQAQMDELNSLTAEPPEFLDLKDPWLHSP